MMCGENGHVLSATCAWAAFQFVSVGSPSEIKKTIGRFTFAPPPGAKKLDPTSVEVNAIGDMTIKGK